jgi:hypothetical protein
MSRQYSIRPDSSDSLRLWLARLGLTGTVLALSSAPVAAHSGTTHAGTPHWLLLLTLVGGLGIVLSGTLGVSRFQVDPRRSGGLVAIGAVLAVFGAVGLVEIQVVGRTGPSMLSIYPILSLLVGGTLAVGGFVFVAVRYPHRPRYAALALVLSGWIVYPTVMPNEGLTHPLGYALVAALPIVLVHILRQDAAALIESVRLERRPKLIGVAAGLLMAVFFLFSAGIMSLNPDDGRNLPRSELVTTYEVADPLVMWPAFEWYFPSVPFSGYLSVGTVILVGTLAGLVGLNVAVVSQQWLGTGTPATKQLFSGSTAISGATACCCCAPAFYGVLSVLFESAATPVYWAFMIPSSPVGSTFFAVSVILLVGSLVRPDEARKRTVSSEGQSPDDLTGLS